MRLPAPRWTVTHRCHAEGCTATVPPRMFACRKHWYMVPKWLRDALWSVYRPGQETDKQVTPLYLLVQARCRLAIAEGERRSVDADRVREDLCRALRLAFAELSPELLSDAGYLARFDFALKNRKRT